MSDETAPADPAPAPEPAAAEVATVEQPVATEAAPAVAPPAPRRRRGWVVALVAVGLVVVLGIVAFVVAEAVAKDYARDYVRDRLVESLRLPVDAELDVDLGGGSIILQALTGRIDSVDVDVPEATFGDLTGGLRLSAEGVPLDAAAPVDALRVDFAIGADDLAALGDDTENAPEFDFVDGEVALSSTFDLFGASIPIAATLAPSAADGALVLTPTSLRIGEQTFAAGGEDSSFLGQIAAALLQPQTLCIAASVPQALVLADAEVAEDELVLAFTGDGAALGGPELSTPGTCGDG